LNNSKNCIFLLVSMQKDYHTNNAPQFDLSKAIAFQINTKAKEPGHLARPTILNSLF